MFAFIKSGFTTDKGDLDDARFAAFMLVVSFIVISVYGLCNTQVITLPELGSFLKDFGIGAAAMAGGIGCWFGLRKDN